MCVLLVAAAAVVAAATSATATLTSPSATAATGGSYGGGPPGANPPPPEAWAWTQLTGAGTQVRYVSTDSTDSCPTLQYTLGGLNQVMLHHLSGPMGLQFPTFVCELGVPLGASNAELVQSTVHAPVHPANRRLPLPTWTNSTRPRSIAVVGDTGCEVTSNPATTQNCQTNWAFPQVANSVATVSRPDLVMHVGDYLYREEPGNENDKGRNPGCTTSADAANWYCVVADFFRPAERLLAEAPVALTRGNHEDCSAHPGGAGGAWFRYLADRLRADGTCDVFTRPVTLRAGTLNLVSVDSSFADPNDDGSVTTAQLNEFTGQFNAVNRAAGQSPNEDFLLFTHKPLWMVKAAGAGGANWITHLLSTAVADTTLHRLAGNIQLVLSGHVHLYQMLDFSSARQPQLTVGSSGGPLDNGPNDSAVIGQQVGVPPELVTQSITQERNPPGGPAVFGYAVLRGAGSTWSLTFHTATGALRGMTCVLRPSPTNRSFVCK
ncbi:MAG: metallophosphoesterase [Actinocatenispora sp.]